MKYKYYNWRKQSKEILEETLPCRPTFLYLSLIHKSSCFWNNLKYFKSVEKDPTAFFVQENENIHVVDWLKGDWLLCAYED